MRKIDMRNIIVSENFKTVKILKTMQCYRNVEKIGIHDWEEKKFQCWGQYKENSTIRLEEMYPIKERYEDEDDDVFEYSKPKDKIIVLHDKIFTEPISVRTTTAKELIFDNCIFKKGLFIESLTKQEMKINLSFCIIIGGVSFSRIQKYQEIIMTDTYCDEVHLEDTYFDKINFYNSELVRIRMRDAIVNKFEVKRCHINMIFCIYAKVSEVDISCDSFRTYNTLNNLKPSLFKCQNENSEGLNIVKQIFDAIKLKHKCNTTNKLFDQVKREFSEMKERNIQATNNLLAFIVLLTESKEVKYDSNLKAKLMYAYYKNRNNILLRFILFPVGYFYKPLRIILLSLFTIIIFGMMYCKVWGDADILSGIYFSGITFFTVGYSETVPEISNKMLLLKNIMVLVEAGIGISLSSSFLTALMNKYIN